MDKHSNSICYYTRLILLSVREKVISFKIKINNQQSRRDALVGLSWYNMLNIIIFRDSLAGGLDQTRFILKARSGENNGLVGVQRATLIRDCIYDAG